MSTSCGWEGKGRHGLLAHSDRGWTCGCVGKTVKSLENTCCTWALLRWWFTTKRRYIKVYAPLYAAYLLIILGLCRERRRCIGWVGIRAADTEADTAAIRQPVAGTSPSHPQRLQRNWKNLPGASAGRVCRRNVCTVLNLIIIIKNHGTQRVILPLRCAQNRNK